MKKVSLLAASVAFALTGCGGSDGDSSGATPGGVVITAIDGYLENAQVWVDTNDNLKLDSEDKKLDSNTNANGEITLPNEYKDKAIFIKAIAGQTIDKTRGLVVEFSSSYYTTRSYIHLGSDKKLMWPTMTPDRHIVHKSYTYHMDIHVESKAG